MSRVCGVLRGPFFSIFTAVHGISAGPCSALVRNRFCSICCLGRHLSERRKTEKTTLRLFSLFFFFFLQPLSSETSVGFKEKKKLPSPPLSLFLLRLCLLLHPSQSSLESIRCTAVFPPPGGRAAFCFFLLH